MPSPITSDELHWASLCCMIDIILFTSFLFTHFEQHPVGNGTFAQNEEREREKSNDLQQ